MLDLHAALQQLPNDQREALILIGASGLSYEEAASICGCAIGTMKSRVNRARNRLGEILSIHSTDELGHAGEWQAGGPISVSQRFSKTGSD
jgi:RNA polymerase sigma-70 factor, ECF subfamily